MSCTYFAEVWDRLKSRTDIDSLVRESFGEYDLQSALFEPRSPGLVKVSMTVVVSMRVVFDLQRTYLQSGDRSPEIISYLISPTMIILTLRKLMNLKSSLFPPGSLRDDCDQSCFIAQTILSGIRILMLRSRYPEKCLSSDQKHGLLDRLTRAWDFNEERNMSSVEKFIIRDICVPSLESIPTRDSPTLPTHPQLFQPACGGHTLQSYLIGLVSFEFHQPTTADQLVSLGRGFAERRDIAKSRTTTTREPTRAI